MSRTKFTRNFYPKSSRDSLSTRGHCRGDESGRRGNYLSLMPGQMFCTRASGRNLLTHSIERFDRNPFAFSRALSPSLSQFQFKFEFQFPFQPINNNNSSGSTKQGVNLAKFLFISLFVLFAQSKSNWNSAMIPQLVTGHFIERQFII